MWNFIQNQMLGMAWLKSSVSFLFLKLGMSEDSVWTHTISFRLRCNQNYDSFVRVDFYNFLHSKFFSA